MKNRKDYIVVSSFRDLKDKSEKSPNGKIYAIGDSYSNEERFEELSTTQNRLGKALIKVKDKKEFTVKELKELAKEKELEGYSTMKKEELIKALAGE